MNAQTRGAGLASTGSVATDPLVGVVSPVGSVSAVESSRFQRSPLETRTPNPPERRTVFLKVRLTPTESARLKEQSVRTGKDMSDIIRAAWKKLKIIELPPADFAETVVQLRRIGNNLNQVARAANMGEVHIPEIQTVLKEIVAIDKKLNRILSGGGA